MKTLTENEMVGILGGDGSIPNPWADEVDQSVWGQVLASLTPPPPTLTGQWANQNGYEE